MANSAKVIEKILNEAARLPDKGWVLNLMGARINLADPLQLKALSGGPLESEMSGGGQKEVIEGFTRLFDSVYILRILSGYVYMNYRPLYIPLTKISHIYFLYLTKVNDSQKKQQEVAKGLIKEIAKFLQKKHIMKGGGPNNNDDEEREKQLDAFWRIIKLIFDLFLMFAPRVPARKLGTVWNLENAQRASIPVFSPSPQTVFAERVYFEKNSPWKLAPLVPPSEPVYGRPNFNTNLPGKLAALVPPSEPVYGRPNFNTNLPGRLADLPLNDNRTVTLASLPYSGIAGYFLNPATTVSLASRYHTGGYLDGRLVGQVQDAILMSGFNNSLGEVSFGVGIDSYGRLNVAGNIEIGVRGRAERSPVNPANNQIGMAHMHPFRWDGEAPESQPDVDAALRAAGNSGLLNEFVFTQGGVVVITFDSETIEWFKSVLGNPQSGGRIVATTLNLRGVDYSKWESDAYNANNGDIHLPRVREFTFTRADVGGNENSYFNGQFARASSVTIRSVATTYRWDQLSQIRYSKPLHGDFPQRFTRRPAEITPATDLTFFYAGRATLDSYQYDPTMAGYSVVESEMVKWAQEVMDHPRIQQLKFLMKTNNTAFVENRNILNTLLRDITDYSGMQQFQPAGYQGYGLNESLNQPAPGRNTRHYERGVRKVFINFRNCIFGTNTDSQLRSSQERVQLNMRQWNNNATRALRNFKPRTQRNRSSWSLSSLFGPRLPMATPMATPVATPMATPVATPRPVQATPRPVQATPKPARVAPTPWPQPPPMYPAWMMPDHWVERFDSAKGLQWIEDRASGKLIEFKRGDDMYKRY